MNMRLIMVLNIESPTKSLPQQIVLSISFTNFHFEIWHLGVVVQSEYITFVNEFATVEGKHLLGAGVLWDGHAGLGAVEYAVVA